MVSLLLFSGSSLFSQEEDPFESIGWSGSFRGYYKNLLVYQENDQYQEKGAFQTEKKGMTADINRLRLSPEILYGSNFVFHADIDGEVIASNYRNSRQFDLYWKGSEYNDPAHLSWDAGDRGNIYGRVKLHRAYVKLSGGDFTASAGRQLIRFGSSRLWNPLDLFNPLSPTFVEGAEDQKGTDALRLNYYISESAELAGVINPRRENDSFEEIEVGTTNYIVRLKTSPFNTDFALLGGYVSQRRTIAFDFARVLLDGMLTGAILYADSEEDESYFQGGGGYEYTFSGGLYFLMEYFYNSSPVNESSELQAAVAETALYGYYQSSYDVLANRIITLNSHYLSLALGYDFTPLVRGEAFSIYDFEGRGLFVNFSLNYNMFENFDLTAGVMTAFVRETESTLSDFEDYRKSPLLNVSAQYYF